MNKNNQNNLDSNDLTSISLGVSGSTPAPNNEVESLNMVPPAGEPSPVMEPMQVLEPSPVMEPAQPVEVTPTAVPIPGTESINPNPMNGAPFGGNVNIGTNPPMEEGKKKKGINKVIFILLIVVLMAGVAFFVYYFLNISNTVKLSSETLTLNVGDVVPNEVTSYAKVLKGNASSCSVNTRGVDSSTMGTYKVIITCGKDTYESTVIITDKEAPKVELNALFRTVGSTLVVDDFVKSCTDSSNCTVKIENEDELNNYLSTPGTYKVKILAEDDNQNQAIYETDLYVLNEEIYLYLKCTSKEEVLTNYNAIKTVSDILPITKEEFKFLEVGRRDYIYKFENIDEYNSVVGNKDLLITFDSITGLASYDEENLTLVISTDLSKDTITQEVGDTPFTNYMEIQSYYQSKGASAQIISTYPEAK